MSDGNKPDSILVFGGNGQMGAPAVALLRSFAPRAAMTIVCRGNWYWDTARTVRPHVRHVVGDRATLATCDEFRRLVDETGKFNLVVNFSAYLPEYITSIWEILKGRVGVYIVISSDSVYEVSVPKSHEGPSVETDAVRPQDPAEQQRLKVADSYGHYKFACEEVLAEQKNKDGGFPYVALRPPDVIGPLDNTDRCWPFLQWLKYQREIGLPFTLPANKAAQTISLVFSEDIAKAVLQAWLAGAKVYNEAINVAFSETTTLLDYFQCMQKHLRVSKADVAYKIVAPADAIDLSGVVGGPDSFELPSVTRGPISTDKAKTLLDWKPTPLDDAIRKTVEFFCDADKKYPDQREKMLNDLCRSLIKDETRRNAALHDIMQRN